MTGPTIRFQVRFRGRGESALVAPRAHRADRVATSAAGVLALAHAVERAIRAGTLKDYREAARRLGISHARMSQIVALLLLAPEVQAEALFCATPWSEVRLRAASLRAVWAEQRAGLPN